MLEALYGYSVGAAWRSVADVPKALELSQDWDTAAVHSRWLRGWDEYFEAMKCALGALWMTCFSLQELMLHSAHDTKPWLTIHWLNTLLWFRRKGLLIGALSHALHSALSLVHVVVFVPRIQGCTQPLCKSAWTELLTPHRTCRAIKSVMRNWANWAITCLLRVICLA